MTSFTQTASAALKYEVSVALRRASRLSCCFPEAALAKPGSSNTTHESLAISVRLMATSGLSVFTRISVPARTVLWLAVILKSLPLRLRTIGFGGAAAGAGGAARGAAAAPAGAADRTATSFSARPAPLVGPGLVMLNRRRPISPAHTAAFQVG